MRGTEPTTPLGPRYQRLWVATAVSNLGNGVLFASLPLLAKTITSSPAAISVITSATALPGLLVALHAGVLVDRLDRRRVMVAMDVVRLVVLVGFAVLVLTADVPLGVIYVTAFLLGAGDVTFDGAARALVPAIVPSERLDAANGRLAAATDTMDELLGPPVGVALFALAAAAPFLFDAGTFAVSAILLATIGGTFRPARTEEPLTLRREIGDGLRFVRDAPVLRVLASGIGMLALLNAANLAVLVLFALDVLDLPRVGFGYLLMTIAIGGVVGSLGVERLTRRWRDDHVLAVAIACNGAAYVLFGAAQNAVVATTAAFVWGAAVSVGLIVSIGMRQALTPDHLLGRVMSVFGVLVGLGQVVGALLGGALADATSVRAPYLCSGVLQLVLTPAFAFALSRARARNGPVP